jgi:phage-related protein
VNTNTVENIQYIVYTQSVGLNLENAEIEWMGNSKEVLSSWPDEIKTTLGFELRKVQRGEIPKDSKHLPGIGEGVRELREADAAIWYRIAYLPRKGKVVYVLHAFQKQGAKTPKDAVRTILQRLKDARRMMQQKNEKERL